MGAPWPDPSMQSDDQALCDALNVGHNALVNARWSGDQQERGGRLLERREMGRGFRDSLATSMQPDDQALCDALNVGHVALMNARWFVDQQERGGVLLERQGAEPCFPDSPVTSMQPDAKRSATPSMLATMHW